MSFNVKRISSFKGRERRIIFPSNQEKRHYWGERDYGFYTNNERIEMQQYVNGLQRNKSYLDPRQARYEENQYRKGGGERINSEPNQYEPLYESEGGQSSSIIRVKDKVDGSVRKQLNLISSQIEVRLPARQQKALKLPEIRAPNRIEDNPNKGAVGEQKRVAYFSRRNRQLNPTFLNSAMYPLSCYRRVNDFYAS